MSSVEPPNVGSTPPRVESGQHPNFPPGNKSNNYNGWGEPPRQRYRGCKAFLSLFVLLVITLFLWFWFAFTYFTCYHEITSGDLAVGITFTVIFNILFLLTLWSYIRVVTTDPGRIPRGFGEKKKPSASQAAWFGSVDVDDRGSSSGVTPSTPGFSTPGKPPPTPITPASNSKFGFDGEVSSKTVSTPKNDRSNDPNSPLLHTPDAPPVVTTPRSRGGYAPPTSTKVDVTISETIEDDDDDSESVDEKSHPHSRDVPPSDLRFCEPCEKYMPPRCYHCRTCRRCVLRQDHHCPWINNCVGFYNHKYFELFLIWTVVTCAFVLGAMFKTLDEEYLSAKWNTPTWVAIAVAVTYILVIVVFVAVMGLLIYHLHLMYLGITTKEQWRRANEAKQYDLGACRNYRDVFGTTSVWCCLPTRMNVLGSGLKYETNIKS